MTPQQMNELRLGDKLKYKPDKFTYTVARNNGRLVATRPHRLYHPEEWVLPGEVQDICKLQQGDSITYIGDGSNKYKNQKKVFVVEKNFWQSRGYVELSFSIEITDPHKWVLVTGGNYYHANRNGMWHHGSNQNHIKPYANKRKSRHVGVC